MANSWRMRAERYTSTVAFIHLHSQRPCDGVHAETDVGQGFETVNARPTERI